MRQWDIYLTGEVQEWLDRLQVDDLSTAELVDDAIYALSRSGPTLGRPLVDTIAHSTISNLQGAATWIRWQERDPHPVRVRPVAVGDPAGRW